MRIVDPVTQCEKIKSEPMMSMILAYASFAQSFGMLNTPKIKYGKPEWYYEDLSKDERKLPYEDKCELRRYKWTLRKMSQRRPPNV